MSEKSEIFDTFFDKKSFLKKRWLFYFFIFFVKIWSGVKKVNLSFLTQKLDFFTFSKPARQKVQKSQNDPFDLNFIGKFSSFFSSKFFMSKMLKLRHLGHFGQTLKNIFSRVRTFGNFQTQNCQNLGNFNFHFFFPLYRCNKP